MLKYWIGPASSVECCSRETMTFAEATRRQREGIPFHGIVYAHQLRVSIGRCVEDLDLIAKVGEPRKFDQPSDLFTALKSGQASKLP
jgi:hypothetical protein